MPNTASTQGEQGLASILLAGGSSRRMGGTDKLWAPVGSEPLIARSLRFVADLRACEAEPVSSVVVAPTEHHARIAELAALAGLVPAPVLVAGGARRQDSVAAGMAAFPDADWYIVHDAARPLASGELGTRVLAAARVYGAAVPGVRLVDTIKRVDGESRAAETLDRENLRAIQTPQAFRGSLLRAAHATVSEDVTDDAAMVEKLGQPVHVVEGERLNLKVTQSEDLDLLRVLVAART